MRANKSRVWFALWSAVVVISIGACGGGGHHGGGGGSGYNPMPTPTPTPTPTPSPAAASAFSMTKLVSDGAVSAQATDANLKNPWGIVLAPGAPAWVANAATQTSTLYDGTGIALPLVVKIPAGTNGASNPTGIVANPSQTDFKVSSNNVSGAARFIFATENGVIAGWSPSVDPTNAVVGYQDTGGASYKGLALASDGSANHLYAADFHNNKVDVFDGTFTKITVSGGFTDSALPQGYAPFGIQALQVANQTLIFVAYAKQDAQAADEVVGAGLGLVDVFDVNGALQKHLIATGGALNAPWGMTLAPANFGSLSNMLLIGNFGDGVINGYDPSSGTFVGAIQDANAQPIATPGLWGIAFGNGARNQPTTTLYFAAGIADEVDGLYGRIDLGATPPDTVAPSNVALTAPAAGDVSGTVAVTAGASDNIGVTQVQFLAGTTAIGTATTAPFTINWDTTQTANGAVALTAKAQDAGGNITTSAAVNVNVNNNTSAPPPPPPATKLSDLQASIFTPICSACHNGSGASLPGSMNLSTQASAFAALVSVTSLEVSTLKRVNPGDPATSYIINKLEGTQTVGSRMPLGGPFLDQATIDKVKSWIAAGAQNN